MASRTRAEYIEEGLLLTDKDAWAWFKLDPFHFPFTSVDEKIDNALTLSALFKAFLDALPEGFEVHLQTTSSYLNVDEWERNVRLRLDVGPDGKTEERSGFDPLIRNMANKIHNFHSSDTWLGIKMGERGTRFDIGSISEAITGAFADVAGKPNLHPGDDELDSWRGISTRLLSAVLSNGGGRFVSINELSWLMAHPVNLGKNYRLNVPRVGAESLFGPELGRFTDALIVESGVKNGPQIPTNMLAVIQEDEETGQEYERYVMTAVLTQLPDTVTLSSRTPLGVATQAIPYATEWTVRGEVLGVEPTKKLIQRKHVNVSDDANEANKAGLLERDATLLTDGQALRRLMSQTSTDNPPIFFRGYAAVRVTGATADEARAVYVKVKDELNKVDVKVKAFQGEQTQLLLSSIPGNRRWGSKGQYFVTDMQFLGAISLNASGSVGDWVKRDPEYVGLWQGYTTARTRTPVFLSPHAAMADNDPPAIAIIGASGAGKSFSAFNLAYQCAAQGVYTIFLDPKADAVPLGQAKELEGTKLFDLQHGYDGMLDPFSIDIGDERDRTTLANAVLEILLGTEMSEERENVFNAAFNKVASEPEPSLSRLVDVLLGAKSSGPHDQQLVLASRNLGAKLDKMRNTKFANLIFPPSKGKTIKADEGLTVITLLGMDFPPEDKNPAAYDNSERLAVAIMYLLTQFTNQLMLNANKSHKKMIFIDEAWAITRTEQGRNLLNRIARMGRSHNTGIAFVSQNATDLLSEGEKGLKNAISTWMCFRTTDKSQTEAYKEALGIDAAIPIETTVRGLNNGECLFRDAKGRVQRVQIEASSPSLFSLFNTNPYTRDKSKDEGDA